MEAEGIKRLVPIVFFLLFSVSVQSAVISSLITDGDVEDSRKIVLGELVKVVGLPDLAAGAENGEWAVKAVDFILDKMNWKVNLTGHETDLKYIEEATHRIATAISWLLGEPQLNIYRSFTKGLSSFRVLFKYVRDLERQIVYGGLQNPVYQCFEAFWPTCVQRGPPTLQGAVVYRFDCGWHFYGKCELKKWAEDGRWHVPRIDGAQYGLQT